MESLAQPQWLAQSYSPSCSGTLLSLPWRPEDSPLAFLGRQPDLASPGSPNHSLAGWEWVGELEGEGAVWGLSFLTPIPNRIGL